MNTYLFFYASETISQPPKQPHEVDTTPHTNDTTSHRGKYLIYI